MTAAQSSSTPSTSVLSPSNKDGGRVQKANSESSSNDTGTDDTEELDQERLPVDRDWILKLLKKFPNPNTRNPDKALVVAPMVDQSDLPFRLLCRRYGSNLCYTPMIHARMCATMKSYQKKFLGTWLSTLDRPLIAQLCGSDPDMMLQAAKFVEPFVDGVDINCGCPQGIARRGNYGAFLLEQESTLVPLVEHLSKHLKVPLSVKVRLLPEPYRPPTTSVNGQEPFDIPAASLALYGKLVDAGVHLLTIHGRTRKQKKDLTGRSDWDTIARAVQMFGHRIPIFANGGIYDYHDVEECIRQTGVDGVMSSESLLEYPPLFYRIPQEADLTVGSLSTYQPVEEANDENDNGQPFQQHKQKQRKTDMEDYQLRNPVGRRTIGRLQLAKEYIELAKQYPPEKGGQGTGLKCIRSHIHHMLHKDLQNDFDLRRKVCMATSVAELEQCLVDCQANHDRDNHIVANEQLSWYIRHRPAEKEKEKQRSAAFEQANGTSTNETDNGEADDEEYRKCASIFAEGEVCGNDGGDY